MLNIAIDMNDEIVSLIQWNFLLRGPTRIVVVSYMFCLKDYNYNKNIIKYLNFKQEEMPDYPTLTTKVWTSINYLAKTFDSFENILSDAFKEIVVTIGNFEEVIYYFFIFISILIMNNIIFRFFLGY